MPHLAYPSDEVVGHILDMWHQVKKKATVIMLLDTSGSMQGDKIKSAVNYNEITKPEKTTKTRLWEWANRNATQVIFAVVMLVIVLSGQEWFQEALVEGVKGWLK